MAAGGVITECGFGLPRLTLAFRYSGFATARTLQALWFRDGAVLFLREQQLGEAAGVGGASLGAALRENGRYEVELRSDDATLARTAVTIRCPPALEFAGWTTTGFGNPPPVVAADGGTISDCAAGRSQLGVVARYSFLPADASLQYLVTRDDTLVFDDKVPVEQSGTRVLGIDVAGGAALPNGRYAIDVRLTSGGSLGRATVTLSC